MKLLLDESIPRRLAKSFPDQFEVSTVQDNGWSSRKNGALILLAAEHNFDALITADKGFEHQHNPETLPITVVILRSHRTRLQELMPLVPRIIQLLDTDPPIGVYTVNT